MGGGLMDYPHPMPDPVVTKALIPAAGWGTRFLPATKAVPKEMLPVVDRPVIQYVVEEAVAAGITDIGIIISSGKEAIPRHFSRDPALERWLEEGGKNEALASVRRLHSLANIHYIPQHDMLGLGHAVLQGRSFIGAAPFAVLLGDTILHGAAGASVTGQLVEAFAAHQAPVVACEPVARERVSRYGVLDATPLGDGLHQVTGLVEKPRPEEAPSNLVIASRYLFTPDIFPALERTGRGHGGEIQLTDAMAALAAKRRFLGCEIKGRRLDVGHPRGLLEACQVLMGDEK